jgi:GT2 family glycosyltransferase
MIPVVVVPVLNRHDLLDRLLSSIDYPVENVLVIDNGKDAEWEYWNKNPNIENLHHLQMPSNLGVPSSWNLGIKSLPHANYWLIVNNDAWFPEGSLKMFDDNSRRDRILLSAAMPPWCAFSIGAGIVERVGLFDEGIYPAYYEDDEYKRRLAHHNIPVHQSDIPVNHDNSSTLGSSDKFRSRNGETFLANMNYYQDKIKRDDFSEGRWSLTTRIKNGWE